MFVLEILKFNYLWLLLDFREFFFLYYLIVLKEAVDQTKWHRDTAAIIPTWLLAHTHAPTSTHRSSHLFFYATIILLVVSLLSAWMIYLFCILEYIIHADVKERTKVLFSQKIPNFFVLFPKKIAHVTVVVFLQLNKKNPHRNRSTISRVLKRQTNKHMHKETSFFIKVYRLNLVLNDKYFYIEIFSSDSTNIFFEN